MDDLQLPFVLWLPGDATPDLSAMTSPLAIPVWFDFAIAGESATPPADAAAEGDRHV